MLISVHIALESSPPPHFMMNTSKSENRILARLLHTSTQLARNLSFKKGSNKLLRHSLPPLACVLFSIFFFFVCVCSLLLSFTPRDTAAGTSADEALGAKRSDFSSGLPLWGVDISNSFSAWLYLLPSSAAQGRRGGKSVNKNPKQGLQKEGGSEAVAVARNQASVSCCSSAAAVSPLNQP